MTLRQFYIHVSENVMKPLFGIDIFGRLAVEYIKNTTQKITTISDSGFPDEAMPVVEHFGLDNVFLIRIHRNGCDFQGDSRSYIDLPIKSVDIDNNGTQEDFISRFYNEVEQFLKE